jgi:hypothetical protein
MRSTSDVIDALGGTTAAARKLAVSTAVASVWRRRGFPRDFRKLEAIEAVLIQEGINVHPHKFASGSERRPA